MVYNPKPMDQCKMLGICDATIKSIQEGRQAIMEGDNDKAKCLISKVYTHGVGQIIDDLRRLSQNNCEHDFFLSVNNSRKKVSQRCRRCFLEQDLEVQPVIDPDLIDGEGPIDDPTSWEGGFAKNH